jgi:hypothetical protein
MVASCLKDPKVAGKLTSLFLQGVDFESGFGGEHGVSGSPVWRGLVWRPWFRGLGRSIPGLTGMVGSSLLWL